MNDHVPPARAQTILTPGLTGTEHRRWIAGPEAVGQRLLELWDWWRQHLDYRSFVARGLWSSVEVKRVATGECVEELLERSWWRPIGPAAPIAPEHQLRRGINGAEVGPPGGQSAPAICTW